MSGNKKILIVEDEADLLQMLKDYLEKKWQFRVFAVSDPLQAEATCLREMPDLIILDEVMPNLKGHELVVKFRQNPQTRKIPIIAMSGLGEMVYVRNKNKWQWLPNRDIVHRRGEIIKEKSPSLAAKAYGVEAFLAKPFNPDDIIVTIQEVFEVKDVPENSDENTDE